MPYLRFSRARQLYTCARCSTRILRHQPYVRDEPHPYARMRGTAVVGHLCLSCVVGPEEARRIFLAFLTKDRGDPPELPPGFEITPNGYLRFPPRVELIDITPQLLQILARDPDRIRAIGPDKFELLICDRLDHFGYDFARVGDGTFRKDGGIDLLAWQRSALIPMLIAVQAKHTSLTDKKLGPPAVRDLTGSVERHGLNAGLLVTNTTFTADARWFAEKQPLLTQLRDISDLQRWLRGEFSRQDEWRQIPTTIELCPGVSVPVPR